ncbi:hypothetical protein PENSPDRAFT_657959 [Peniophora sp. CONT]|nr:hypothetical protein PENSPDRAFT_657959 [Peniophora sp. CONT]
MRAQRNASVAFVCWLRVQQFVRPEPHHIYERVPASQIRVSLDERKRFERTEREISNMGSDWTLYSTSKTTSTTDPLSRACPTPSTLWTTPTSGQSIFRAISARLSSTSAVDHLSHPPEYVHEQTPYPEHFISIIFLIGFLSLGGFVSHSCTCTGSVPLPLSLLPVRPEYCNLHPSSDGHLIQHGVLHKYFAK